MGLWFHVSTWWGMLTNVLYFQGYTPCRRRPPHRGWLTACSWCDYCPSWYGSLLPAAAEACCQLVWSIASIWYRYWSQLVRTFAPSYFSPLLRTFQHPAMAPFSIPDGPLWQPLLRSVPFLFPRFTGDSGEIQVYNYNISLNRKRLMILMENGSFKNND